MICITSHRIKIVCLLVFLMGILSTRLLTTTDAYYPQPTSPRWWPRGGITSNQRSTVTTSLNIIGPLVKRFREDQAKKNRPMADFVEAAKEAPGLKVGTGVWRWPGVWPYDDNYFLPCIDADAIKKKAAMNSIQSMLTGVAQLSSTTEDLDKQDETKFDAMKYWAEEQQETSSIMQAGQEAIERLQSHFAFYIKDGMSVLEFGADEVSYLPPELKLRRYVGIGASKAKMDKNLALTESIVVNLSKVTPGSDVDSDELRALAQDQFDVVIMSNTAEFLEHPREVFRTAWYLLKPGGLMMASFLGKENAKDQFSDARTRVWQDYNDDQHIWITGSYFHYSAGDGWENLLGFDITPDSAKQAASSPLSTITGKGKKSQMFVVQATKGSQDTSIDLANLERSIQSLCWMLPVMEDRDKKLVVPRLARAIETANDPKAMKDRIENNIQHLPTIYEALVKMDQFAFTFNMQAQLAVDLICESNFSGSQEQILSMKEGLGLRTPSPEFWAPVGQNTAAMGLEDKISLLAYLSSQFGSNDVIIEEKLRAFATGLQPTYAVIRSKCPDLDETDVQLLGTEFLAAELLSSRSISRSEYAAWITGLSDTEIREFLLERKNIRVEARNELVAFREARDARNKELEEYRRLMNEQIKIARETRSLYFNPRTQKMELMVKKK